MTDAPWADLLSLHNGIATVRCPYCGREHTHPVTSVRRPERRAPGCGMYRSANDRATGYRFATRRDLTDD